MAQSVFADFGGYNSGQQTSAQSAGTNLSDINFDAILPPTSTQQKENTVAAAGDEKRSNIGWDSNVSHQQNLSNAVDNQIYHDDANFGPYQMIGGQKIKFRGEERNLYIDDTKDGNYKLGLATQKGGFDARYDPNDPRAIEITNSPQWRNSKFYKDGIGHDGTPHKKGDYRNRNADGTIKPYGWEPGPGGVTNRDGALMDISLPKSYADNFEYGVHSSPGQIKNRAMGQGAVTQADIDYYGSGKTEITTPNAPMWNQDYQDDGKQLLPNTPVPTAPKQYYETDKVVSNPNDYGKKSRVEDFVDRTQGSVAALAAGTADYLSEAAFNIGQEAGIVDKDNVYDGVTLPGFLGSNSKTAKNLEASQKYYGADAQKAGEVSARFDAKFDEGDYLGAIGSALGDLDYHVANSMGEMVGIMMSPGKKKEYGIKAIKGLGDLPKLIGKFAHNNAGLINVVNVRTNNQAEEFEATTGRPQTSDEMTTGWLMNFAALSVDKVLLRAGISGDALTPMLKQNLTGALSKRMLGLAESTVGETIQEMADQVVEQVNTGRVRGGSLFENLMAASQTEQTAKAGITGGSVGLGLRGLREGPGALVDANIMAGEYMKDKNFTKSRYDMTDVEAESIDANMALDLDRLQTVQNDLDNAIGYMDDSTVANPDAEKMVNEIFMKGFSSNIIKDLMPVINDPANRAILESVLPNMTTASTEADILGALTSGNIDLAPLLQIAEVAKEFDTYKANTDNSKIVSEYLKNERKVSDLSREALEKNQKLFLAGKDPEPYAGRKAKVDINSEAQTAASDRKISDIIFNSKNNKAAEKELRAFSDKQLNDAKNEDDVTPKTKTLIDRILRRRENARAKHGFTKGSLEAVPESKRIAILKEAATNTKKNKSLGLLNLLKSVDRIETKKLRGEMLANVAKLKSSGQITKTEAELLKRRITRMSENAAVVKTAPATPAAPTTPANPSGNQTGSQGSSNNSTNQQGAQQTAGTNLHNVSTISHGNMTPSQVNALNSIANAICKGP